jgi:fluoride exporter
VPGPWSSHQRVLPVIAAGGMLGASGRYALDLTWPSAGAGLPWATLVVNLTGCALIGVLMVHVTEVGGAHPLLRPFLGVGVLGGYTTFSTYAVQTDALLREGRPELALLYFFGTVVTALAAVTLGVVAARIAVRARRWSARHRGSAGEETR